MYRFQRGVWFQNLKYTKRNKHEEKRSWTGSKNKRARKLKTKKAILRTNKRKR